MITWRRVLAVVVLLLVLAVAWTAWLAYQTQRDLRAAEDAVDRLQSAVDNGDATARDAAAADLREAASAAADRTDGIWWGLTTHVPVVGDDAAGVESLSASLDSLGDAVESLTTITDGLDTVVTAGRVDTDAVTDLQAPVAQADDAVAEAADRVVDVDSSGFIGSLRTRFDDYAERVSDLGGSLGAARTATQVLPSMLGADGPRRYLLVFQNNAELRATGGLPGSWAEVEARDGAVTIARQGSADTFPFVESGIAPLTAEEVAVYGEPFAQYWQDPGFTPDFPRAAELFEAHYASAFPDTELDGVLALDPVAMSYVLAGTGPVDVSGVQLTADNVVQVLLEQTYRDRSVEEQDAFFQEVARAVVTASTQQIASPRDVVEGFARAARERRLLVAPKADDERELLAGTPVLGELSGDDGSVPHVDIGLNDTTGSKMSYYLRYDTAIEATSCDGGRQQLAGSMDFSQTVTADEARALPEYVNGGGVYGIEPGTQLVAVRIYGPHGGEVSDVRIDGQDVAPEYGLSLDGRPVVLVGVDVSGPESVALTWSMSTGDGQDADGEVLTTPGVVPGSTSGSFASAC